MEATGMKKGSGEPTAVFSQVQEPALGEPLRHVAAGGEPHPQEPTIGEPHPQEQAVGEAVAAAVEATAVSQAGNEVVAGVPEAALEAADVAAGVSEAGIETVGSLEIAAVSQAAVEAADVAAGGVEAAGVAEAAGGAEATGGVEAAPDVTTGGVEAAPDVTTGGVEAAPDVTTGGVEVAPEVTTGGSQAVGELEVAVGVEAAPESGAAVARKEEGGKKSLLELLGAMKVDVTTKRKVRTPRPALSEQPMRSKPKPTTPVVMETTKEMFQEASAAAVEESADRGTGLNPELVAAASAAASTLPNSRQATSELLRQLRHHEAQTHTQQPGGETISNIIADMKVGRRANGRSDAWPSNQIRFDEDGRGYTQDRDRGITGELDAVRRRKSSFSGKRLNVFIMKPDDTPVPDEASGLSLWDLDLANRIAMATNQLPRNGFEEMLLWTRQDQLWQYPINNEAGLEEESSVPFHEHVFLERHLAEGFPSQGPVRHFMELVITGLAKNPHLTANQKQEHIGWFRNYFQEKKAVLEEAEAYGS
ncbi:hypothetical protein ACEWY4_009169 [Coilia grayii]|uniref:Small ribosomal subunit protein mS31 n=1 Tax=Coilia grayii TaxID=363190 RepID=A0ABD1K5N0_9TELE